MENEARCYEVVGKMPRVQPGMVYDPIRKQMEPVKDQQRALMNSLWQKLAKEMDEKLVMMPDEKIKTLAGYYENDEWWKYQNEIHKLINYVSKQAVRN